MGTNAVRLVEADHRHLRTLAARLQRPYRDPHLRGDVAAHLRVHVALTRGALSTLVDERVPGTDDDSLAAGLTRLEALASELDEAADPVEESLAAAVVDAVSDHERVEAGILLRLQGTVSVEKLRDVGDVVRRERVALRNQHGVGGGRRRTTLSRTELYERAKAQGVVGRSAMNRAELQASVSPSAGLPGG